MYGNRTIKRALRCASVALCAVGCAGAGVAEASHTIQPGYYSSALNPGGTFHWGIPSPEGFLSHSTGSTCSGSARPGSVDLARYLEYWYGDRLVGLYNCRTTNSGSLSLHAEGRAIDYHVSAFNSTEKAIGDRIFALFRRADTAGHGYMLMRRFGVQEVIWNCKIYSASNLTIRTYSYCANGGTNVSQRHEDHVHIGLNREGAERRRTAWTGYRPCYDGHSNCGY